MTRGRSYSLDGSWTSSENWEISVTDLLSTQSIQQSCTSGMFGVIKEATAAGWTGLLTSIQRWGINELVYGGPSR